MIAPQLHPRRVYVRFALLCLALVFLVVALGMSLAVGARQRPLPRDVPITSAPACVSAPAPSVMTVPMVPILTIKPASVEPSPVIDRPRPIRVRYAKSVHGRVRGRFAARD